MADKTEYALQLMDQNTGQLLQTAGGAFIICAAGSVLKATLENPAADFASLANPVSATYGRIRFAIPSAAPVQSAIDVYGITGDGRAVFARNIQPGTSEIWVAGNQMHQMLVLPLHITDFPATVETQFGISLPTGALVGPHLYVKVLTADATETLDIGLLASESGDADGFAVGVDVGTAGSVVTKAAATASIGALLRESIVADAGTASVPKPYIVGATARKLTATTTAGSDTLQALVGIPYTLPLS